MYNLRCEEQAEEVSIVTLPSDNPLKALHCHNLYFVNKNSSVIYFNSVRWMVVSVILSIVNVSLIPSPFGECIVNHYISTSNTIAASTTASSDAVISMLVSVFTFYVCHICNAEVVYVALCNTIELFIVFLIFLVLFSIVVDKTS
jgi:hypothetical protein